MKSGLKRAILWTAGVIGLIFFSYVLFQAFSIFYLVSHWSNDMAVGRKYMDSLSERDFEVWEKRTKGFLSEYSPKGASIGGDGDSNPVPDDLARLGIIRISIRKDEVAYIWMGGMDHTALVVDRKSNGNFSFYAQYDDEHGRQLWPRADSAAGAAHTSVQRTGQPTPGR